MLLFFDSAWNFLSYNYSWASLLTYLKFSYKFNNNIRVMIIWILAYWIFSTVITGRTMWSEFNDFFNKKCAFIYCRFCVCTSAVLFPALERGMIITICNDLTSAIWSTVVLMFTYELYTLFNLWCFWCCTTRIKHWINYTVDVLFICNVIHFWIHRLNINMCSVPATDIAVIINTNIQDANLFNAC